jgi:hypothetical protein
MDVCYLVGAHIYKLVAILEQLSSLNRLTKNKIRIRKYKKDGNLLLRRKKLS